MGANTSASAADDLKSSLAAFETSLETPVVSGDLAAWASEVKRTWADASSQLDRCVKLDHARQYDEMSQQDPEMLPRIEQLKQEDAALEAECERLNQSIKRMVEYLPKLEPDEEKARKPIQALLEEGLNFINRARKQEVAIQTWYVEAFSRDHGSVD